MGFIGFPSHPSFIQISKLLTDINYIFYLRSIFFSRNQTRCRSKMIKKVLLVKRNLIKIFNKPWYTALVAG